MSPKDRPPTGRSGARGPRAAVEVPSEQLVLLETIARRVGGSFNMTVKIGEPGGGSYFDTQEGSITFDPVHILEDPAQARFVAGHEGAHRAISPSPSKIGLSPEDTRRLYGQIGFGYLQNAIEDPAVNDWLVKRFPGLRDDVEHTYDGMFREENAALMTPEVARIASQLGYVPRFAQFGSEVIRDWHMGGFSASLDPDVKDVLKRTIEACRKSRTTIPNPLERSEVDIIGSAQERFRINTGEIWPDVRALVEKDLHLEELRRLVDDWRTATREKSEKEREAQQAREAGDEERTRELEREIDELTQRTKPIDDALEEAREELERKIDEARKRRDQEQQAQGAPPDDDGDLTESTSGGMEGKPGPDGGPEPDAPQSGGQPGDGRSSSGPVEPQPGTSGGGDEVGEPVPFDELSQDVRDALEKAFGELSDDERSALHEKAREQLEKIEDRLNEELESKLDPNTRPHHHRVPRDSSGDASRNQATTESYAATERALEEMRRKREASMTPYERARAEVAPQIEDLYRRLLRIFKPDEEGEEESGYASGIEPDFSRVMGAEHDPSQLNKIWKREGEPKYRDIRFWHLLDVSGSMEDEPIMEALKGFIVIGEAVDRLERVADSQSKIKQGITAFHRRVFPIKDMASRFVAETTDILSTLTDRTQDDDAGTNTYAGTQFAYDELKKDLGESGNFLLTFSDGNPNYASEELADLLEATREERKRRKVKIGLVWIGEEMSEHELEEYRREFPYDFILMMPAVQNSSRAVQPFSQRLADLLEDIVLHPDSY